MSPTASTPRMSASSGPNSPQGAGPTPATPRPIALGHHPADSVSSSISTLMLDQSSHSRSSSLTYAPDRGGPIDDDRSKVPENYEADIETLLTETQLWRVANSVLWISWGVVQAAVAGMPQSVVEGSEDGDSSGTVSEEFWTSEKNLEEEDFDYLGYARDRALFFWGDLIHLGVLKPEELPVEVQEQMKVVPY
jgi:choline kinase